ncbi:squalene/phytoene synthase family protein [Sphingosinicella soli]|uniref:Phytoene synthase n=1 Tax=Sphingosinicella soli TaxID=333708 RepID=A0A7W7AZU6_9SPHN|nr:squalene/phytoene synthase family protein [Sphingosinicella soli]MBB4631377.1 phytoene synthase [Sphingosinicella soli]
MADQTGGNPRVAETTSEMEAIVRTEDRDRYVATLFAPAAARPGLFALHAFDLALAEVVRTTTEPQIGMIRLAWWRDSVQGVRENPVAGQPVLAAVAAAALDPALLAALAEAHMDALDGAGLGESGARLFGCGAALLGAEDVGGLAEAGRFWAHASARRRGAEADLPALQRWSFAPVVRPVTALAAVARRDAAGKREPRGAAGRQFAILRHVLTGRV